MRKYLPLSWLWEVFIKVSYKIHFLQQKLNCRGWGVGWGERSLLPFSSAFFKVSEDLPCLKSSLLPILNTHNNFQFLFPKLYFLEFRSFLLCVTQFFPVGPNISWSLCQKVVKGLQQRLYWPWIAQKYRFLFLNTLLPSHPRMRPACFHNGRTLLIRVLFMVHKGVLVNH